MVRIDDIPEDSIVFYDIETGPPVPLPDGVRGHIKGAVSAAYSKLHMIAFQLGLGGEPELVDDNNREQFRQLLLDPNIIKVSYNGINFDDMVLWRHGYYVEPRGRHDMYLALKTVAPTLPSYSLKFVNRLYLGDWHEPEGLLWDWLKHHGTKSMYSAPHELLAAYCKHDVTQTINVFRMIWEVIQKPMHWPVYRKLELKMAEPLHEMVLLAGEYMNLEDIEKRIQDLTLEKLYWNNRAVELSKGEVQNVTSSQQVSRYLKQVDDIEFEASDKGNLVVRKSDLIELMPNNEIAKCAYECRNITKVIGYLRSYYYAARYERERRDKRGDGNHTPGKINGVHTSTTPVGTSEGGSNSAGVKGKGSKDYIKIAKSYYLSAARTRRFLSSSMFGINFQNQNKRSKIVQLVPPGWLGCWFDLTQIENLVHIWASADEERRISYEGDPDWSEYVWLTNMIMGEEHDKDYWDSIDSPENPSWSIYKQYKTIKLALNFGMGPDKFAKTTGLARREAMKLFTRVQEACPAIKSLQNSIRSQVQRDGFVQDPFGHIYSGNVKQAYKIVAYLVQGCGTGSIPKAMTVANYEVLHSLDSDKPICRPNVRHPYKRTYSYGIVTGTTHDEISFRISLGLPKKEVLRMVHECIYNMTDCFADKFGGMPMRVKTYFSVTNAAEQKELDHRTEKFDSELEELIYERKRSVRTF